MKDKVTIKTGASLPILGILGAVLVVLKSMELITLPWLWVLAPFWLPVVGLLVVLTVIMISLAIAALVK